MARDAHKDGFFVSSDKLTLYYRDYMPLDDRAQTPVLCLHGLTRNSRDFDPLARHLARTRRVIAPDFRGRGRSDYDPDWHHYQPEQYLRDTLQLLDALGESRVITIGTSLGGWISMLLTDARPDLIDAVVINDIGPEADPAGLARVVAYAGRLAAAEDFAGAVEATRGSYALAFPDWDAERWAWYTRSTYRQTKDGHYDLNFDRTIGTASRAGVSGLQRDPWQLYDTLRNVPTLLVHGALSDILTDDIVASMCARKPDLQVSRIPNRGHAPLLDEPEALDAITRFVSQH